MSDATDPQSNAASSAGTPLPVDLEANGDLFRASATPPGAGSEVGEGGEGIPYREASGGEDTKAGAGEDLESAGPGYQEKQAVYADRYGASIRTVKLWIAEGRAYRSPEHPHGFPPPLDDPEAMLGWWHEVKTNRTPARLLIAAETAKAARATVGDGVSGKPLSCASEGEEKVEGAPAGERAAPPPPPVQQETTRETGFAASLKRVRIAEAEAHGRYLEALAEPDEAKRSDARIERLRKAWSELSEQLRFLEKAAPDVLSKSGEMLTRDNARRILSELHSPIVAGVRSLFRRVRAKAGTPPFVPVVERLVAAARSGTMPSLADLEGMLAVTKTAVGESLDDLEKIHAAEVEKLFGDLYASEFAPRLEK